MKGILDTIFLGNNVSFEEGKEYFAPNCISFCYQVSYLFLKENKNIAIIASSLYSAQSIYEQISNIVGEDSCLLFPVDEIIYQNSYSYSKEVLAQRLYVMDKCFSSSKKILVLHYASCRRYLPSPNVYKDNTLFIEKGKEYSVLGLVNKLVNMGFTRVNKIDQSLQFALRGDILDVFPINEEKPLRIEFFDDEVESIRLFDIESQMSICEKDSFKIFPATDLFIDDYEFGKENVLKKLKDDSKLLSISMKEKLVDKVNYALESIKNGYDENYYSLYHFFQKEVYSIFDYFKPDISFIYQKDEFDQFVEFKDNEDLGVISELFSSGLSLNDSEININFSLLRINNLICTYSYQKDNSYGVSLKEIPFYSNNILSSLKFINDYKKSGYKIVICLKDNFEKYKDFLISNDILFSVVNDNLLIDDVNLYCFDLKVGFIFEERKILFLSKKEIFNYRQNLTIFSSRYKKAVVLNSFEELDIGDYVVHEENGIGEYQGIVTLKANNVVSDYLKVLYANDQYLYIPLQKFSRIRKYVSREGSVPRLSKLGGKDWSNVKEKIKNQVNFLAERLINLYAERESIVGYSFKEDDEFQEEFESSFPYPLTRDQKKAIDEIKLDMEKPIPMDRLLCGDVGFGKTEVAFRAAFKAILSGKQVALLCPTTILAKQHYDVATSRFSLFDVKIALFSRFVPLSQQNKYIKEIKKNKIHLIIGTHRILSNDIEFNDLGLLIVDEEQKFGVEHKERIKELTKNVDVLTLSATPIPRTLQMSLLGIRNFSQLQTAPVNRMPIQTYVNEYNERLIKEVIARELSRGGQVFYLHNTIATIYNKAKKIQAILPNAKVGVVHSKMDREDIDYIMVEFYLGNIDILVCTSIVESGLDIPNANTIIIEDADKFGLSQLYQIKGRVGRSNRVAYAYLFFNPNKELTEIASERLSAIKKFTELGSGYKIAQKDLSIRGAGDILGSKQSGFIDNVGLDMYVSILNEVINDKKGIKESEKKIKSTNITIGGYIPSSYAVDVDKIQLYQEIEACNNLSSIEILRRKIKDIYGRLPSEVEKLLLKRKIDILSTCENIYSVYEDENIVIVLDQQLSSKNGMASFLSNKFNLIMNDLFVSIKEKRFVIKIKKNKNTLNNLLFILEIINGINKK